MSSRLIIDIQSNLIENYITYIELSQLYDVDKSSLILRFNNIKYYYKIYSNKFVRYDL